MTTRSTTLLYALALAVGIVVLYALGLNNQLVFDDARLTDGTIFSNYGSLGELRPRLLSYGSFVWLQAILGDGWWKQRLFNIGLHIATAFTLYALVLALLERIESAAVADAAAQASAQRSAARLGVALWAFNPVAVYAVAYLIQRSIVMATLLVALACWSYVRALVSGKRLWYLLACVCYLLAVAAKEHAIAAVCLTVPLFIFVKRPGLKRVLGLAGAACLLLGAMGALLYSRYGSIIGAAFDENSRAFVAQLELLQPGISQHIYPLSLLNQAGLFFRYGAIWLLPYVGWMSIDIRPAFPLTLLSWHVLGALAWIGTLVWGVWLLLRRSDAWGLFGLCLLIPGLLFITEFATVWVQDPFVLYRSYLWSIGVPLLLALVLLALPGKVVQAICVMLMALLAAFSFDRIHSLQSPSSAWTDASEKIDRQAPPNAVGRWRPLVNLGTEFEERGDYAEALRLFGQAEALGEPLGSARFNMGVSLQQLKQYPQALDNFAQAEAKGFTEAALYYQRGESQYALARFQDAFESFSKALQRPQAPDAEQFTRMRQAEAGVASQNYDAAIASYKTLIQAAPDKQRYQVGLSMAYLRKQDFAAAMALLNATIAAHPAGPAYYARALTHFFQGNRTASRLDLETALRAEPDNPIYRKLQQQLDVPTGKSAAKP